jgi:WS/DGAT/MGAT family acyltransferase
MQQLSGHDASFIYLETPNAPMHGGGLSIYDQSTAPDGRVTFTGILDYIEGRLHMARAFRQKLVRVPLDLDHPYWIEDPEFDLEYHVRHIALPKPGDWRQLCILTARIVARPLDLNRPLWEMYVVEGLDNVEGVAPGSFAVLSKMHHAAVDGVSGMEILTATHDLTADAPPPPPPERPWQPEPVPSPVDLLARAGINNMTRPMRWAELAQRAAAGFVKAQQQFAAGQLRMPDPTPVPRTRFNAAVSAHRVFEGRRFDLSDIKRIKSAASGATVNDVVLAIVGGALRSYLQMKGELPDDPLMSMCPVSVRGPDEKADAGNKVSAMYVTLSTDVADPGTRLSTIHRSTSNAKAMAEAIDARSLTEFSQFMPGGLMGLANRLASDQGTAARGNPPYNTVVTNIPGPPMPLYSNGALLEAMYSMGMIHDGMGLMHVVGSYRNDLTISITSDREMMTDPATYADCLVEAYEDLAAAV